MFGAASTAWVFFAGRYVPYIDWSNHLALIAVLADGGDTGALEYMHRSWRPTPYFLFYGLAALLGQFVTVDIAAKMLMVVAGGAMPLAAASLADACGRSPRLGLIAPLGLFGIAMGYGFSSFVFATPVLLFTLASAERFMHADDRRRAGVRLAAWLCVAFLAHALVFLTVCLIIGVRALVESARTRSPQRALQTIAAAVPAVVLSLPATIAQLSNPWNEESTKTAKGFLYFVSFDEHLSQIWGHLLHRGSGEHVTVMWLAVGYFGLLVFWSVVRRHPTPARPGFGLEWYALALTTLFLFGPNSMEWPSSLWLIYPRFGVIAGVVLLLLPRVDLRGWVGVPLALAALVLVGWNADLNARSVRVFSSWAKQYDPVREFLPPGQRILALTLVPPGDLTSQHPALGSLYFYHMVDGASYVAFIFDVPAKPTQPIKAVKPRQPFWKTPHKFDPKTHGQDYDYLVLRGAGIIERVKNAGTHDLLRTINGWAVFKTKNPTPRPSERKAP